MPPKRKVTEPLTTHASKGAKVRRSTRASNAIHYKEHDNSDTSTGAEESLGPAADPSEPQKVFERAMKDLGEMGLKLQSAVRKQRLAIETSDLSKCDTEKVREDASKTRPPTSRRKARAIREAKDESLSFQQGATEDIEMEPETTALDVTEERTEAEAGERSSRRPPPVNSPELPLPWRGRLGYACLNTYLRAANPPVFSSRTCRISSILEHRYPLRDPSQPEHAAKNRPDKTKEADEQRGLKWVQDLGLLNAKDIVKMLRWNDKYGIKFMRLSSEMFPFASHGEYGYKLAPFAAEVLAEAGKVVAELGHRVTTHPGQFTQIASPRKEVVTAAFRDLEYHDEMLSLLKLPEQQDRDAVMILHMGGTYGDKSATLDRFRENYPKLTDGVKRRLVLENDDVSWSVHDLLPICEELNVPLVLDFHHHNIIFDKSIREGTLDIMSLYDRIAKTWSRKNIQQKMHYSEPTAMAVTPRERRRHSARVKTLPPCLADMDLMIEAKDKEQAVFELMRTFKLPGWDQFNDIIPHERDDEAKKQAPGGVKRARKAKKGGKEELDEELESPISSEDFGMGGPQNRVYWPEGMEEWLRPKKREASKKAKRGVADNDDE